MRQYRFILLPILAGLIIVLVTAIFTLPKIKTIVSLKERLEKEKEQLSRLTQKTALLEGFDQYELSKKVTTIEMALPSKKAPAEILTVLSYLSAETGVILAGFDISPGALDPEKSGELTFRLTIEGSKEDLRNFLVRSGSVLPIIKVISFGITGNSASMELESYYSLPPKTLGKIDSPLTEASQEEEKVYQRIAQFKSFENKLPKVPVGKKDPFSSL